MNASRRGFLAGVAALAALFGQSADLEAEKGEPFVPVLSVPEGPFKTAQAFPELEVFRDAVPFYQGGGKKTVPRMTALSRVDGAYVRRTRPDEQFDRPYRLEEIVTGGAETIDNDYTRSGKPFFVCLNYMRPPFFLPKAEEIRADRADYAAWKARHPGLVAFEGLSEIDSDSHFLTVNYRQLPAKDGIREHICGSFEPPAATGLAHRVSWAREALKRVVAMNFGEKDHISLCSNTPGYEHVFAALGAKYLSYEATADWVYNSWNVSGPFVRGAARQWGKEFMWYCAQNAITYTRDGVQKYGANYLLGTSDTWCPYGGESESLAARQVLYGWLIGAKWIMPEHWACWMRLRDKDGNPIPSPIAHKWNDFYKMTQRTERGETVTPLAVLTPFLEPFTGNYDADYNAKLEGTVQKDIFDTLVPMRGEDPALRPDRKKGEEGCMYNSRYAGLFDVLCPDAGQPSADFEKALSRYCHVLVAGTRFDERKFDRRALDAFAKKGGVIHRYPSAECPDTAALAKLLDRIQRETMPVQVDGDIQWGVNRTSYGYLVWLINNRGVVQFKGEPTEFRQEKTAHVTVTTVATGERTTLDVPPGGYVLHKILLRRIGGNKGEWTIDPRRSVLLKYQQRSLQ